MVSLLLQVVGKEVQMMLYVHILVKCLTHLDRVNLVLFQILNCHPTSLRLTWDYFASIDELFLIFDRMKQLFHRFQVN